MACSKMDIEKILAVKILDSNGLHIGGARIVAHYPTKKLRRFNRDIKIKRNEFVVFDIHLFPSAKKLAVTHPSVAHINLTIIAPVASGINGHVKNIIDVGNSATSVYKMGSTVCTILSQLLSNLTLT
jgi:hypothetical protein